MKRQLLIAGLSATLIGAGLAFAIGPRGGGGGGGQRPANFGHANPSLGGGARPMGQPSGGMMPQNRPAMQQNRPNTQFSRPSMGQPSVQRPSQSGGLRPGGSPSAVNRPGGLIPQQRPQSGGGI